MRQDNPSRQVKYDMACGFALGRMSANPGKWLNERDWSQIASEFAEICLTRDEEPMASIWREIYEGR